MGKTLFPLEKGFPHVTAQPNLISVPNGRCVLTFGR